MTELSVTDGRGIRARPTPCRSSRRSASPSATARPSRCSDAHIRVLPGESHALVGRNGAGKSTLVGILTGLRAPDSGEIRFSGEPAPPVSDRDAWRPRVACVYQHSTIIPDLTVAENLFVNRQPTERGLISWTRAPPRRRASSSTAGTSRCRRTCAPATSRSRRASWSRSPAPSPTAPASSSSTSRPRSSTATRSSACSCACASCRQQGVTFLFISHHLQEVYEICQAVTVLRDARHIVSRAGRRPAQGPADRGDDRRAGAFRLRRRRRAGRSPTDAPVALEVERSLRRGLRAMSASPCAAARCSASPARPAAAASASPRRSPGSAAYAGGTIRINGRELPPRRRSGGARARRRLRPEEPAQAGPRPVAVGRRQHDHDHRAPARAARLHRAAAEGRGDATPRSTRSASSPKGPEQLVSSLSGGNQQKVVMGRALANAPSVLVLMDPTAGVDVKSKEALLAVVERMRARGQGDPGRQRRARGSAHLRPRPRHAPRRRRRRTQGGLDATTLSSPRSKEYERDEQQ